MSAADWFPVEPGRYLKNTMHLTTRQHGGYWLLIMAALENDGKLPGSDMALASIAKLDAKAWKEDGETLKAFLTWKGDHWVHEYAAFVCSQVRDRIENKRKGGKAGGGQKWGGRAKDAAATRSERLAAARAIAKHTPEEWAILISVCGDGCVRCGSVGRVEKDHIVPIYQGGSDGIDNLQPVCAKCNSSKGPEAKDHRPPGWRSNFDERMANAKQMADRMPDRTPSRMPDRRLPDA